jgi:Ca2+-binding RTX toxin-like protein
MAQIDSYTDTYFGNLITQMNSLVGGFAANDQTFAASNLFVLLSIDISNWFGPGAFGSYITRLQNLSQSGVLASEGGLSFGTALLQYVTFSKPRTIGAVFGPGQALRRLANIVSVVPGGYQPSNVLDAQAVIQAFTYLYLPNEAKFISSSYSGTLASFVNLVLRNADTSFVNNLVETYGSSFIGNGYGSNVYVGLNNNGSGAPSENYLYGAVDTNNDILVAGSGAYTVFAGSGNDILVSGGGSDKLIAGSGNDTLISTQGNTVLEGGAGQDEFVDFAPVGTTSTMTVNPDTSPLNPNKDSIWVGRSQLQGPSGLGLVSSNSNGSYTETWTGSGTVPSYSFTTLDGHIGTLLIFGGPLGQNGSIVITNFNFDLAQTSGFLGIHIAPAVDILPTLGGPLQPLVTSTNGSIDPTAGDFSLTAQVSDVSAAPQSVQISMSGVPTTGFAIDQNGSIQSLSNGPVTLTIAPGASTYTFGLLATSPITQDETVQLTAALVSSDGSTTVSSSTYSIAYQGESVNTVAPTGSASVSSGGSPGHPPQTNYVADGLGDSIVAGSGLNSVNLTAGGNNFVTSGSGNDTIWGTSGDNTVAGGGGADLIWFTGSGSNQIFANSVVETSSSAVNLPTVIAQAAGATASDTQGDFIGVGDGNNTIVGGNGNDFITAGSGSNLVVLGPGDDTFMGGTEVTPASDAFNGNWSVDVSVDLPVLVGIAPSGFNQNGASGYTYTGAATYNGILIGNDPDLPLGGVPLGLGDDTILTGSSSSDVILSNGDNDVELGSGVNTVIAGEGDNTITGGSSYDVIRGGGGNLFVNTGSGAALVQGGNGNNTILGGSGSDTIYSDLQAAGGPSDSTSSSESNYVFGGSGNDVIWGSAANDTLIAGSGNTQIYGYLLANTANQSIVGGSGNDYLYGGVGTGSDTIVAGGAGNDTLVANAGNDTLYGGAGVDSIVGGAGSDVIYAGDGGSGYSYTTVTAGNGNETIYGGLGLDSISGGSGADVIYAGDGGSAPYTPSIVFAGSGATTVYGGDGFDEIVGGSGSDVLYAGDGGTGSSPTYLSAGTGSDSIYGGAGSDVISAVTGSDTVWAGSGSETITGSGQDSIVAGAGFDSIQSASGSVVDIGISASQVVLDQSSAGAQLDFDTGIDPTNFTVSSGFSDGEEALVLDDGSGATVTIDGGLGGAVNQFDFADSGNIDLDQLMADTQSPATTLAGAGGNLIFAADGSELLQGGSGADSIYGWGANDTLVAGSGDTLLQANDSGAVVIGGTGLDSLYGGIGGDTLVAGAGDNTLVGGTGGDTFALAQGGNTQISASTVNQVETIVLPSAMSLSNFIPIFVGQDLLLQSTDGSTSALIKGYAGPPIAGQTWLIQQSGSAPVSLATWVQQTDAELGVSSANYSVSINGQLQVYQAEGEAYLSQLAQDGDPKAELSEPAVVGGEYQYNGTNLTIAEYSGTVANTSLSGSQSNISSSANDAVQVNTSDTSLSISEPTYAWFLGTTSLPLSDYPTDANGIPLLPVGSQVVTGAGGVQYVDVDTYEDRVTGSQVVTLDAGANTIDVNRTLTDYLVTGDGGNDTMASAGPFVGTVLTGNGNVSVNLGGQNAFEYIIGSSFDPYPPAPMGAFIEAGSGNDSMIGSIGNDTLVAGTGFDYMDGGSGANEYFVPMEGYSTEVIDDSGTPTNFDAYGGTVPPKTLVLPVGVSISDLSYRSFQDPAYPGEDVLQISFGDSNVLIVYNPDAGTGIDSNFSSYPLSQGVNTIEFANGTTMSLEQFMAQATQVANDFAPVVTAHNQVVSVDQTIQASSLFAASDSGSNSILWYRLSATGNGGAAFDFNGNIIAAGQSFLVNASQLNQVTYLAGPDGASNSVTVSAFDGATWSSPAVVALTGGTNDVFAATGPDQLVTATPGIADTISGAYSNDTLVGGGTADTFIVSDSSVVVNEPTNQSTNQVQSSVSYTLPTNVDTLVLTGTQNITGTGNSASDVITGNSGEDTLIAGTGPATLVGNSGSDTFVVNSDSDVVEENQSGTAATVASTVSYVLPTNVNSLILTGTSNLSASSNSIGGTLQGNSGADILQGGSGSDTLIAGGAGTTLIGGTGNELFVVNSNSDVVEANAAANNTVAASVSYVLPSNVAVLDLTGSGNLEATGNALNDIVQGNSGQDTIIAGSGTDTLVGGSGGDTFVVDNASDLVTAQQNTQNSILSSVSYATGANVQTLTLTGSGNLLGTAGIGGETVTANAGNDTLVSAGNDTLIAGAGVDSLSGAGYTTYVIDNSADTVTASGSGSVINTSASFVLPGNVDTLNLTGNANLVATGNGDSDKISANSGSDTIISGSAVSTLVGGTGADTFYVNNADDLVEAQPGTQSTEISSVSFAAGTGITSLTLTGSGNLTGSLGGTGQTLVGNSGNDDLNGSVGAETIVAGGGNNTLTGGSGAQVLMAGSGNDTLDGGSGPMTLDGGTGSDLFIVNDASTIVDAVAGANNSLESSVSYVMPSNLQTMTMIGYGSVVATGNNANDSIVGNYGNDTLISGSGVDTLVGQGNVNVYDVNNSSDVVQAIGDGAANTVNSSVSYVDPTNVQTLNLLGSANLSAVGNAQAGTLNANSGNDTLTAGTGADTLVSGSGVDSLVGTAGNDLFIVNNAADIVSEQGTVGGTVQASVNFVLPTNVNTLVLQGSAGLVGTGNASTDQLTANSLNDSLVSGTGVDTLISNSQGTVFYVNNSQDVIQDGIDPTADIYSSVNYVMASNTVTDMVLTGSANLTATTNSSAPDTITGNAGNDTLTAAAPQQTLIAGSGVDTLIGDSAGNDTFVLNNAGDFVEASGGENVIETSVSAALPTNVNTLIFTGTNDVTGSSNSQNDEIIANNASGDLLLGGSGQDTLVAGSGYDTLQAGTGATTLIAGSGSDTMVVNSSADVIVQGTGTVSVQSSVNFALPSFALNLKLTGSANLTGLGNALNGSLTGNSGRDTLTAGSGNESLIAGTGVDTLVGGVGLDTFEVDNASDVVQADAGSGSVVQSSVSYVVPENIAALTLTGSSALSATGNDQAETITANSGADTLTAGTGNQTLVSGSQVDTLVGGSGVDVFVVKNSGDVIQVSSGPGGNDLVQASVSYVLPANLVNLTLTGAGNLTATGNSLNDVLTGNSGTDTLTAGSGVATLIGGTGTDTFVVNNVADVVGEQPNSAKNLVDASVSYVLPANVENLTLTGSANLTATGNTLTNTLTANSGNDTLIAGSGVASMVGGAGTDTFVVNNSADSVHVTSNPGGDLVEASVSYVMPTNLTKLTLTGIGNLSATANGLNDSISGNSGNDTLKGGAGTDTLVAGSGTDSLVAGTGVTTMMGGSGTDTFVVTNSSDVVQANASGTNIIQSSVSYVLPSNIAELLLTGNSAVSATANSGNDLIIGNAGSDTLTGGTGIDVLQGGTGTTALTDTAGQVAIIGSTKNDTLQTGAFNDFLAGGAGADSITTGASDNVIAFNAGNGKDTLNPTTGALDTISLGGGISEANLTLSKSGNNLVLGLGGSDSITFANWYASSSNQDVDNLQLIEGASPDYNPSSGSALTDTQVVNFNFTSLVNAFNQALVANPGLTSWSMTSSLLSSFLSGSNSAAIGGDLAFYYGENGNLTGLNLAAADSALTSSSFGSSATTVHPWSSISQGTIALH